MEVSHRYPPNIINNCIHIEMLCIIKQRSNFHFHLNELLFSLSLFLLFFSLLKFGTFSTKPFLLLEWCVSNNWTYSSPSATQNSVNFGNKWKRSLASVNWYSMLLCCVMWCHADSHHGNCSKNSKRKIFIRFIMNKHAHNLFFVAYLARVKIEFFGLFF